jgi:ABC-type molybdenum transport system ATPase subunit/photorepair protein PhrA
MTAGAPRQLTIEYLRGSVGTFSLPFEKGKRLTVIYGENGTGKTTICDAFEFLGKGRVSSLENRGLGKTSRYWHSLGKKPADISVTLESANSICRATVGKNEVICNPSDTRPRVEVLRRSQILALIEATPGERYDAIRRFIDVTGVEASEASLRQLIADLSEGREVAVARVQENEDEIRRAWETAEKPGTNPIAWADAEASRDANVFAAEINSLSDLHAAYSRLTDYPGRLELAEQALTTAQDAVSVARNRVEEVIQSISQDAGEMVGVLEAAREYLSKYPSPPVCPVCESSERIADLANRITQRLNDFASLRTAQTQATTSEQAVLLAEQQLQTLRQNARDHTTAFEKFRAVQVWPSDIQLPSTSAPGDPSGLQPWLVETSHLPSEWKKAEAARYDKKQSVNNLKKALNTWRDNTQAQKDLDRLIPRLQSALKIMEEERRRFTDDVLSDISEQIGLLYEAVHPGEGLNKISLELDPKKRASLEIGASFCGQDTPPQAYFSDSHLDTLGLCVFIALSALDQPENTILVLDDVLASVDEPHVERLIEMLYSEAIKFRHCVITTHYRPWKQKLRWGWLQNGECQFVELTKWTALNGLALIRSTPDIERLEQLLAESPPDPQLVCAKAGVILEAALDFLTLHYECAVPRRPGGLHTLGDLLPAIDKKLRAALRMEVFKSKDASNAYTYNTVSLRPILDELTRIAQARNVFGAHFNELSFDLLDADALAFGRQVLELMKALTDDEAGWPRNGKSGEYWATAGETRRLYPFKKPA